MEKRVYRVTIADAVKPEVYWRLLEVAKESQKARQEEESWKQHQERVERGEA